MELNCAILSFIPAGARLRGSEGIYSAYKVMAGNAHVGNVSGKSAAEVRAAGVKLVVENEWKLIGPVVMENARKAAIENELFVRGMDERRAA